MIDQLLNSTRISALPNVIIIIIILIYRHCHQCTIRKYCLEIFAKCAPYFLLIFVKPFDWWASKAIGDWKGPDVGYLSAGAYFWAKADKLTRWQNIPSKPRPVTLDCSLFISKPPSHLDLSRLKDVSGNTLYSQLLNLAFEEEENLILIFMGWTIVLGVIYGFLFSSLKKCFFFVFVAVCARVRLPNSCSTGFRNGGALSPLRARLDKSKQKMFQWHEIMFSAVRVKGFGRMTKDIWAAKNAIPFQIA